MYLESSGLQANSTALALRYSQASKSISVLHLQFSGMWYHVVSGARFRNQRHEPLKMPRAFSAMSALQPSLFSLLYW